MEILEDFRRDQRPMQADDPEDAGRAHCSSRRQAATRDLLEIDSRAEGPPIALLEKGSFAYDFRLDIGCDEAMTAAARRKMPRRWDAARWRAGYAGRP